nr:FAD-dependent thymidylate synthase [Paenibacillus sp. AR247]
MSTIEVLDQGYVRLVNHMGSDLTVVNAARVSYAKQSLELNERDVRLIKFLAREGHTSPFRHAIVQFEVYAPLMVARQWWKYVVGSAHYEGTGDSLEAWNESSRRYITEDPAFYIPKAGEWRLQPENSKQGSGGEVDWEIRREAYPRADGLCGAWHFQVRSSFGGRHLRGTGPVVTFPLTGCIVRWYWTASVQSVAHFLSQRLEHDAQKEIQEYAKAVLELIKPLFPFRWGASWK